MLGLWKIVILVQFFDIFVECSYPKSLSVRKLNRQLVERKRQNTVDLCRMFNVENEKTHELHHKEKRVKRSAPASAPASSSASTSASPAPPQNHEEKVEAIVDKLYDELDENGTRVTYRKPNLTTTRTTPVPASTVPEKSGRRFDFAPSLLTSDIKEDNDNDKDVTMEDKSKGRTVPIMWHKYWKHAIIPFFIDPNTYDTFLSERIIKAFDYLEQTTCIRLQRLREKPTDKDSLQNVQWLYITNPAGTRQCVHSNELKPNSGVQWVVFGYDCMTEGEILHEVMHILGFSHEHVREDRDQYVSVLWDNIKPGYKRFFEIKPRPAILAGIPYDYASVLHYPPRAFSKNGKFTLTAESSAVFGQREGLSEMDVQKVSLVYGGECIDRNKQYLVTTCPTVMATKTEKVEDNKASQQDIENYFKDKIWPYGIVNYKIKDRIEFSIEERQNIDEVIKHIEKETCIEFRDLSPGDDDDMPSPSRDIVEPADDGNILKNDHQTLKNVKNPVEPKLNEIPDTDVQNIDDTNGNIADQLTDESERRAMKMKKFKESMAKNGSMPLRRVRRGIPVSPARRHADDVLLLVRSPEPGCQCPEPGRPIAHRDLVINADCFNSVNDLLHLFVHVLGLDHQHNMHDRDDYLAINWTHISQPLKEELKNKLPPAASVGFAYDYQSVTHYPWLDIKNGVTNIMYPVWNDGWAMGHWQGLSSIDVQKLNLLYFEQCQARKKHIQRSLGQY